MAAASNLSYYSLTGRFNETNQSGFRGAVNLENRHILSIQDWISRQFVLPIRSQWNGLAGAAGVFKSVTARELVRERRRFSRYDVIGPGRHLLDPDKETKGSIGSLRASLSTLKLECMRRGLHWIKVLRQMHLEKMIAGQLGLSLDYSNGGGASSDMRSGSDSSADRTANTAR